MQICFKLFASLTEYLPSDRRTSNHMMLEVAEGSSVADVIAGFQLPLKWVHLVLVNGRYVAPDDRCGQVLAEGDVLAIWPPIAGG
jgi:sulfur carrier protein ThiS